MRADFLVMKTSDSIKTIPYFMGQNQVERVFIEGQEFFA
jgi:imidazolonepropionase-like amidohydrolase